MNRRISSVPTYPVRCFTENLFPRTYEVTDPWGMVETLETVGSVVTTLSAIGTTIVKGR